MRGADWAARVLLVAVLLAIWSTEQRVPNEWGDDWAGYLLQARAIASGMAAEELAVSSAVIDATDVQIGPPAYPWGYPLVLAVLGPRVNWDPRALTLVGGVALVVLAVATHAVIRQFLTPGPALLCASLAVVQAPVILMSLVIASDLTFCALTMTSLALSVRACHALDSGSRVSLALELANILTAVGAFTVRSNGAILVASHAAFVAAVACRPDRRRAALAHLVFFSGLVGLLVVAYFAIWPDGSLGHARLLVFDPREWPPRLVAHVRHLSNIFSFAGLPGPERLAISAPVFTLALVGAVAEVRRTALLTLYTVGHLFLLTLFPYDQGGRYYLPIVAPLVVLVALGVSWSWRWVMATRPSTRRFPGTFSGAAIAILVATTAFTAARELPRRLDVLFGGTGPFSPATQTLARYLQALPPGRRLAYRKPRALRYLSGHAAVAIAQESNLDRVDVYVLDIEHTDQQVTEAALTREARFVLIFDQPPYRVYERQPLGAPKR